VQLHSHNELSASIHKFALQILYCGISYAMMIHTFTCADTEALFHSQSTPRFVNIERVARRKLLQLHAAGVLDSLKIPPGNRLEALKGKRKHQHSIRINEQWRLCFEWRVDGAYNVAIIDYH
jgi:proteic killer suppression protein